MAKDKTTLPFEVIKDESKEGKVQAGIKRIEVFLGSGKADAVLSAIRNMNLEATLYDSKGFGKEKEKVRVGRGMSEAELSYSTRQTIVTIVDSDKLEEIINTIKKSAGSGGVGIIAISPMDALIHM